MHHSSRSAFLLIGSGLQPLSWALLLLTIGTLGCEQWAGVHDVYIQIGEPEPPAAPAALDGIPPRAATAEEDSEPARLEDALLVVRHAAQAAFVGQLERARAELSGFSPGAPGFPQALFVRACIALEAGNLTEAAREIASLREALPARPEPRLLEHLLVARRQQPALGWREAFLRAWNEAGRPNLREDPLLGALFVPGGESGIEAAWQRTRAPDTRLMLALSTFPPTEERARFVLEQLPSIQEPEWAVAAFEFLRHDTLPEELRAQAAGALVSRLDALSAASPGTQQLRVLRLLGLTELKAPLTPEELSKLEAISTLPRWRKADLAGLHAHARRHLEGAGVPVAAGHAFMAVVGTLAGQAPYVLLKRAQVSLEQLAPAERERLGRVLWSIGSRLAAESTVLEHQVGSNLMRHGAMALKDEARLQQVEARIGEVRAALDASHQATLDHWPLHSLQEALLQATLRDEVGHVRGFLPPRPAGQRAD
jgi:hypothetical protein